MAHHFNHPRLSLANRFMKALILTDRKIFCQRCGSWVDSAASDFYYDLDTPGSLRLSQYWCAHCVKNYIRNNVPQGATVMNWKQIWKKISSEKLLNRAQPAIINPAPRTLLPATSGFVQSQQPAPVVRVVQEPVELRLVL